MFQRKIVECFKGTPQHPFFTTHGIVAMCDLKPGMEMIIRNANASLFVKAVGKETHPEGIFVYNFEVAGDHTYFVGNYFGGIFVHNLGCNGGRSGRQVRVSIR